MRMGLAPKLHELTTGNADRVDARSMTIASADDERVREAMLAAATYIGIAAANVVAILHPDLIVLGGGVSEIGPLLTDRVAQVIAERVGMFPTDGVRVIRSQLADRAGLLGAIALAREAEFG